MPSYFTPDEANALLAEVRPLAERMVEHRRGFVEAEIARAELLEQIAGNGGDLTPADMAEANVAVEREAAALARCVREISALGGQVKDLDRGLIDFPALREGEEILLCWELGEDQIGWWHRPDAGFGGRQPL